MTEQTGSLPLHFYFHSKSIVEPGDIFRFRGLRGSSTDQPDNGEGEWRIEILGIEITGLVGIECKAINRPNWPSGVRHHQVPYGQVLRLIEDNIWQPVVMK